MGNMEKTCGWDSDLPTLHKTEPRVVRMALDQFVRGAEDEQKIAWDEEIPMLQKEAGELIETDKNAKDYYAILEYQLPLEARRPDAIILLLGPVVVIEFKTKDEPSQADLDQVSAYARDLRCYHGACDGRKVYAVVVPTKANSEIKEYGGQDLFVVGPNGIDKLLGDLMGREKGKAISPKDFLNGNAYRPLPTLVQAARELFESHEVREIWKARASTDPAVDYISKVAHEGAKKKTRHLVLVRGVPGSGKTLVGLRTVHAKYLDDLSVLRQGIKPTAPGIFLSGNGPLVQVLQYELKKAGGAGKAFIRGMKDYLHYYVGKPSRIPDQHIIVFDEAQRAFNEAMVAATHEEWEPAWVKSEPELILGLGSRIPEWCIMVGLIGSGQEIHKGEEDGIEQWRKAIDKLPDAKEWTVHIPSRLEQVFTGTKATVKTDNSLNLDVSIRHNLADAYAEYVETLLVSGDVGKAQQIAANLQSSDKGGGMRLYITRDLKKSKRHIIESYENNPNAKYGLLASSKDKVLERDFDVPNSWQATKRVKLGPWYADTKESPHSCTQLRAVVTEFGAQGLELDMALLAWGTDLMRVKNKWSNEYAGGYQKSGVKVKDPFQLRINAYRVLLTRGRDGTVIFVPDIPALNETYEYLLASGFSELI